MYLCMAIQYCFALTTRSDNGRSRLLRGYARIIGKIRGTPGGCRGRLQRMVLGVRLRATVVAVVGRHGTHRALKDIVYQLI